MSKDSTYNYRGSEKSIIEDGILRGKETSYVTGHNSYGEFLLERLRDNSKFIGEVDGATGREVNYAEMMEKSVKCAMWLREEKIKIGDVVGICTHNQIDMYVPCFASLYIGAVYNPWWDTGITKELAKHFLNLTKPKVLFVDEISASMILEVTRDIGMMIKIIVFGKISDLPSLDDIIVSQESGAISEFRCTKLSSIDESAVIVYTSGTTGLPKGSLHSNRSLFGNTPNSADLGKIEGTMRSMMFSPLAWSTGVSFMLRAVSQCETRIIYHEFNEEKTFELVEKYKINWLFLGASGATRLQRSSSINKYDLSSLKYIWTGGSAIKKATQEAMILSFPRTKIRQVYGITELGGAGIIQNDDTKFGSIGKVACNISMKVIDTENGKILGPMETGEALFKSPFMMTRYLDNPEATRETIDAEGWLHSGDIVYYDESGDIYITDRIKEIIKHRGNHVSPMMVEKTLQKHPDVMEVAVLGIPHKIDDEHPIAFVLKTPNAKVTKEELEDLVAAKLPDYMRLRGGVEFIDEMPYTSSGKIARNELKKLLSKYTNL